MNIKTFDIQGLLLLTPKKFEDERGFFLESFNSAQFCEAVRDNVTFVQDNHSRSLGKVLRGLHYQLAPRAQGKLVRCTRGKIIDIAVDIRKSSPTFGKWVSVELSEENLSMFWIPPGFAHGFATLSDVTDVLYKTTDYFSKEHDRSLLWNDEQINVKWPDHNQWIISAKDKGAATFDHADVFA